MPNDKFAEARRGKDQSLGVAWNKLGCARLRNENPDEAEPCFQKSIDALGALEGASRISISMPLINIASAHWLQEKLDKAASTFEEALDVREREYGVNDRTSFVTGDGCVKVANHYVRLGKFEDALSLLEQALKIYGGREHFLPEKARVVYKRARLFGLMDRKLEAQGGIREALRLLKKIRPATLKTVDSLEDSDFDKIVMFWSR